MKKMLVLLMLLLPMATMAQDDLTKKLTKFEQFSSKTGRISKFVDVKMPNISESFMGSLSASIRTLMGGQQNAYFYRIEEAETRSSVSHIAMIEYSDLVEINKALAKFITDDGFQIGYYVSKGKASWYLKLERYSNSTVFIKNAAELTTNFTAAQKKIEELKATYGK